MDLGDGVARGTLGGERALGGDDELRAPVDGVGDPTGVAQALELVHGVHHGGLGELCPLGELGDPDAGRAEVCSDREQGGAQVGEAAVRELLGDELADQEGRLAQQIGEGVGAARGPASAEPQT